MEKKTKLILSAEAQKVTEEVRQSIASDVVFVIGGGCCEGTTLSLFERDFSLGYVPVGTEGPWELFVERGWKSFYEGKDILVGVEEDDGSDRLSLEARLGKHFTFKIEEGVCPA